MRTEPEWISAPNDFGLVVGVEVTRIDGRPTPIGIRIAREDGCAIGTRDLRHPLSGPMATACRRWAARHPDGSDGMLSRIIANALSMYHHDEPDTALDPDDSWHNAAQAVADALLEQGIVG